MKKFLEKLKTCNKQIWTDSDLILYCIVSWIFGAFIGYCLSLEPAKAAIECIKPLVG